MPKSKNPWVVRISRALCREYPDIDVCLGVLSKCSKETAERLELKGERGQAEAYRALAAELDRASENFSFSVLEALEEDQRK